MYLEIDEGFPEHPKTLQLCAALENPTAFAYLINFWRWACRSCQDGDLQGMTAYAIEEAAKYHRHDGKLYAAMAAKLGGRAGFLDVDESGAPIRIHNWEKRTGAAIQRMEDEAERKRLYRAHKDKKCGQGCKWCETEAGRQKNVRGQSAGHPETSSGPSAGRPQDIPTQSSPDQTSTDPDLTPPSAASIPASQGSLFASGSGEEQPACQSEPTEADSVRKVFDHYRTHHKRAFPNPIRESKEWRLIAARLREGNSVEYLCKSIDGYHRSPFHRGENTHHREYLALELIMRDGSHVEAGIGLAEQSGGVVLSERERRSARAAEAFLARGERSSG
jgi:hypothetical protein